MVCVYCSGETYIKNSRSQVRNNSTWRRHRCIDCNAAITTIETVDYSRQWVVENDIKHFQPFSRDKLYICVYRSLKHRKDPIKDASGITATIISNISKISSDGSLTKQDIMRITTLCLNRFDKTAALQYKAFHKYT